MRIKFFILLISAIFLLSVTSCSVSEENSTDKSNNYDMPVPTARLTEAATKVPEEVSAAAPTRVPAVLTSSPTLLPATALDEDAFSCTSPDGKYTAAVENSVIINVRNAKGEEVTEYNIVDGAANSVMALSWFNNTILCINAHINPDTSYYCIFDVEQKQVLVEKYGGVFAFMDHDNYKSLIYTQVPPHFSDEVHIEKILDMNDKVLYEAPEAMIIFGLCADDETGDLAFTTQNIDRENNHLSVLFKADNSLWSTPLDFNGNIDYFKKGHIIVMNGSRISVFTDSVSRTQSNMDSFIIENVNDSLKEKYNDIDFTNGWIESDGHVVLFGSLKSDSLQGLAVEIDTQNDNSSVRYLTPKKYGAVKALSLLESQFAVEVSAENGHVWIYNLYGMGFAEKPSGSYAGKWEQIERLRYVEGSIISVNENEDGTAVLKLQITANYHGGADPVDSPDFPYPVGSNQEFVLQSLPDLPLDKCEDIVVYQTGVAALSEPMYRFTGAVVRYYKKDGKYYDTNDKAVTMPPQEYPQFEEVFNQSIE